MGMLARLTRNGALAKACTLTQVRMKKGDFRCYDDDFAQCCCLSEWDCLARALCIRSHPRHPLATRRTPLHLRHIPC